MKERPGLTTTAAWFSWPMSDCSCLFVADRLVDHKRSVLSRRASLASGSLSSCLSESITIPRKVMEVEGPATLSGAAGRPSSLQRGTATLRASAAAEEEGGGKEEEVIQVMQAILNSPACHGPGEAICNCSEELGG